MLTIEDTERPSGLSVIYRSSTVWLVIVSTAMATVFMLEQQGPFAGAPERVRKIADDPKTQNDYSINGFVQAVARGNKNHKRNWKAKWKCNEHPHQIGDRGFYVPRKEQLSYAGGQNERTAWNVNEDASC